MQIYQEDEVCKVDNNNIKIISTVSSKNFMNYLERPIFQNHCIKSYKIRRNGLFFNVW